MKYLSLTWKLIVWNIICFLGMIFLVAFVSGEPRMILAGAAIIGLPLGTIIGFAKYQNKQKISK
jgi:hypothetical protein